MDVGEVEEGDRKYQHQRAVAGLLNRSGDRIRPLDCRKAALHDYARWQLKEPAIPIDSSQSM